MPQSSLYRWFSGGWAEGGITGRNSMSPSDNEQRGKFPGSLPLGELELFFARKVLGRLSSLSVSIRDIEGWCEGSPPASMTAVLGSVDYTIARQGPLLAEDLGDVIDEEARRSFAEKLSPGGSTP